MICHSMIIGVLAGLLLLPIGRLAAEPTTAQWDSLVKAAKAEGKVELILSGQLPQRLRPAIALFEKKYAIRVNYQTGGGNAHADRILAERRFGRYTLDVWLGGANTALAQLMPNKAIARFDELLIDPEVTDTSKWFLGKHHYTDPEGHFIFTYGASPNQTVSYNTKMVDPNEIKSYADLLDPKWKGKIVSWSPASQGTAAGAVPMYLNPKIGDEWFRRWATEMKVTIVSDARQGAELVALGRFPIGMFGLGTQAETLRDQGLPIQGFLPHPMAEGEVLSSAAANLMVMDKAPNPRAAQLFVNWALSRDAQIAFVTATEKMDTLRVDTPRDILEPQHRIRPDVDYIIPFSDPEYINRQNEVLGRLKKIMQDAGYR